MFQTNFFIIDLFIWYFFLSLSLIFHDQQRNTIRQIFFWKGILFDEYVWVWKFK